MWSRWLPTDSKKTFESGKLHINFLYTIIYKINTFFEIIPFYKHTYLIREALESCMSIKYFCILQFVVVPQLPQNFV